MDTGYNTNRNGVKIMADLDFLDDEPENGCWSDLMLDRLLVGELDGTPEEAALREHLSECQRCADRHAELARNNEKVARRDLDRGLGRFRAQEGQEGRARRDLAATRRRGRRCRRLPGGL